MSDNKLLQRYGHGATLLAISPTCTEVVMVGGKNEQLQSSIADTVVLRFGNSPYVRKNKLHGYDS